MDKFSPSEGGGEGYETTPCHPTQKREHESISIVYNAYKINMTSSAQNTST